MTEEEGFTDEDREWFWNPDKYPEGTEFPRVIAPWHVIGLNEEFYNQKDIYKTVVGEGMIESRKKADPGNTNCWINWPMMLLDNILLGHNPYIEEFGRQVRQGMASRPEWLIKLKMIDTFAEKMKKKEIDYVMDRLDLDMEELKEKARGGKG
jgi:hypothetical protein